MPLPVVFLPGIMGSRLRWRDGSGQFWDPDNKLEMLHWIKLGMRGGEHMARAIHYLASVEVMTHAPDVNSQQTRNGWGGVASSYYLEFLKNLDRAGYPVFAIGYDWRQDLLELAMFFQRRLAELNMPQDFALVTHSMGGLLVRAALAMEPGLAKRIRGVIHLCQPCHGAAIMYRRMFTGCHQDFDGETVLDRLFCQILGTSGRQFLTNACGLLGALQLLPSAEHMYPAGTCLTGWIGTDPSRFVTELYGHAAYPPGITPSGTSEYVTKNLSYGIGRVAAFQDRVRKVYHPNSWFLFGQGRATDVAFFFSDNSTSPVRLEVGDGTVPAFSAAPDARNPVPLQVLANAPGKHRHGYQTNLEHAVACNDPDITSAVLAILGYI